MNLRSPERGVKRTEFLEPTPHFLFPKDLVSNQIVFYLRCPNISFSTSMQSPTIP